MLFSIKKTTALRGWVFLSFASIFFLIRSLFIQNFLGYSSVNSDVILRFFFYLVVVFTLIIFREQFAHEEAGNRFIRAEFLFFATLMLFVPATLLSFQGPYLVVTESLIGAVRNIFLLLTFFPVTILYKNKILLILIGLGVSITTLLSFYLNFFWKHVSFLILKTIDVLFSLLHIPHHVSYNTFEVSVKGFTVFIGSQCAGIGMITAFLVLSIIAFLVAISQKQNILLGRACVITTVGVFAMAIINLVRIMALILIGAYWSPQFAMTTFHSAAGAILFFLFFLIYTRRAFKQMIRV